MLFQVFIDHEATELFRLKQVFIGVIRSRCVRRDVAGAVLAEPSAHARNLANADAA